MGKRVLPPKDKIRDRPSTFVVETKVVQIYYIMTLVSYDYAYTNT